MRSRHPIAFATLFGLVAALIISALAKPLLQTATPREQRENLASYVAGRADAQHAVFDAVSNAHQAAIDQFMRTRDALTPAQADALFDFHFPLHSTGIRRGRDADYEGYMADNGVLTYGMGSFLGGQPGDRDDRLDIVAGFLTVRSAGPALAGQFDNFHFTDYQTIIIFAPERDDQLMYYRQDAPADLTFNDREFVRMVQPAANPDARIACTSLSDVLYERNQRALTIGCHTPLRLDGVHLGAFGTTLQVRDFLSETINDPTGREALVISDQGRVVAHPALFGERELTDQDVARTIERLNLDALVNAVTAADGRAGVMDDPSANGLAAFAELDAPGWRLVVREPYSVRNWRSWALAGLLGLIAGLVVALQVLLLPNSKPQRAAPNDAA